MTEPFLRIRAAEAADAAALAAIHEASWLAAYRGIIPERTLRASLANHNALWWGERLQAAEDGILILMAGDAIAGYCVFGRARRLRKRAGEIYEIYLEPAYQGLGFGASLFEAARAALDRRGLAGLLVWVLSDNTNALRFYEARGGKTIATAHEPFGTVQLQKTALWWE